MGVKKSSVATSARSSSSAYTAASSPVSAATSTSDGTSGSVRRAEHLAQLLRPELAPAPRPVAERGQSPFRLHATSIRGHACRRSTSAPALAAPRRERISAWLNVGCIIAGPTPGGQSIGDGTLAKRIVRFATSASSRRTRTSAASSCTSSHGPITAGSRKRDLAPVPLPEVDHEGVATRARRRARARRPRRRRSRALEAVVPVGRRRPSPRAARAAPRAPSRAPAGRRRARGTSRGRSGRRAGAAARCSARTCAAIAACIGSGGASPSNAVYDAPRNSTAASCRKTASVVERCASTVCSSSA